MANGSSRQSKPRHGRTYLGSSLLTGPGILFVLLGTGVFFWAVYHLVTGTPMEVAMQGNRSTYMPGSGQVVLFGLGGLLTLGGGILSLKASKNMRVVTTQEGLSATNFLGKTMFLVRWENLERMDNRPAGRGDRYFSLESGKKRLEIDSRYLDFEDLIEEIRDRAPQISETYYD